MPKKTPRDTLLYLSLFLSIIISGLLLYRASRPPETPFLTVYESFRQEKVKAFAIDGNTFSAELTDGGTIFYTIPDIGVFMDFLGEDITAQMDAGTLEEVDMIRREPSILRTLLPYIFSLVILFVVLAVLRQRGGGGAPGAAGRGPGDLPELHLPGRRAAGLRHHVDPDRRGVRNGYRR